MRIVSFLARHCLSNRRSSLRCAASPQAYKLRQVQATYIKPESGRLMLVLHVSTWLAACSPTPPLCPHPTSAHLSPARLPDGTLFQGAKHQCGIYGASKMAETVA